MRFKVNFRELDSGFSANFGETQAVSDGGYERGYAAGYASGHEEGYAGGLAARTCETWTITLTDGSIVEKEVALL